MANPRRMLIDNRLVLAGFAIGVASLYVGLLQVQIARTPYVLAFGPGVALIALSAVLVWRQYRSRGTKLP
jgi:hypothetical protein